MGIGGCSGNGLWKSDSPCPHTHTHVCQADSPTGVTGTQRSQRWHERTPSRQSQPGYRRTSRTLIRIQHPQTDSLAPAQSAAPVQTWEGQWGY